MNNINIKQAKKQANEAFSNWSGFPATLPTDILFCVAGNIKHNNWKEQDLNKFFDEIFTIEK